jgi:trehalose synthase
MARRMTAIRRPIKRLSAVKVRPSLFSFSEQFYPARPTELWRKAQKTAKSPLQTVQRIGLPIAGNSAYVRWLRKESMLQAANRLATHYSGRGSMWRNPFARPQPRRALAMANVWYTAYPASLITKKKQSILLNLADDTLWDAFEKIGIQGMHTGPMKLAGGINGWQATPSIDGHFDRISQQIDSAFGTAAQFKHLSEVAKSHHGIIIDDIVPGHTGKGADFRLAEMNYGDYPGIYHMVEIDPADWHLLPTIPKGLDSMNLDTDSEAALHAAGYIVGKLPRVIFYEPGVKDTNWSATKAVRGIDGVRRRWVYLHYFKAGQPSINWLDPSFAGMKLVVGDALNSIGELGSSGLRLDANGFLGIEKGSEDEPAWSEGHPLSEAANMMIAGTVRKLGGFTFQELNLSMDDIKTMSQSGADLSYDFVNRPAYHHALVAADTEFLRLTLRNSLELGIDPASLVHALQNHDELTYELVHFWTIHKDDVYQFRDTDLTGLELRHIVRQELRDVLTAKGITYNQLFSENGVACTTASIAAAALGITDLAGITESEVALIIRAHLLLAMFNAWQPGVFALSGWDLTGALPLDIKQVVELIGDGDTRWINRGAYDLADSDSTATTSTAGMPKAISLYGSLPRQLENPNSFACRLRDMIAVRTKYKLASAHQIDIPAVAHKAMLVMVHRLDSKQLQITVLNFSNEQLSATVTSNQLPPQSKIIDTSNGDEIAQVDDLHNFSICLEPFAGHFLLVNE